MAPYPSLDDAAHARDVLAWVVRTGHGLYATDDAFALISPAGATEPPVFPPWAAESAAEGEHYLRCALRMTGAYAGPEVDAADVIHDPAYQISIRLIAPVAFAVINTYVDAAAAMAQRTIALVAGA